MFWPRYHNIASASARWAFTMVELLIVVAILAILVAVLLGVSNYVTTQNNTALTRNCMDILDAAIGEFHAITGHYPEDDWAIAIADNTSLIFGATEAGGTPTPDESLYLQLSILPQTREIISKLSDQLITQPISGATVTLAGQLSPTPYLRSIVDPWENPLEYDDYDDPDRFPEISSAGPDGGLGTEDDITNAD